MALKRNDQAYLMFVFFKWLQTDNGYQQDLPYKYTV